VTTSLRDAGIRAVLLDIEGTTTPITFVHDVLFPYARARVRAWLSARPASDREVKAIVDGLRREAGDTREWTMDAIVARVHALMDEDRKSHPLKELQGRIWQEGYASGVLKSDVYADVPAAFARWSRATIDVGIFSSGSVLAQQQLFAHSNHGDLTRHLRWHFDTSVGPKVAAESYRRIAGAIGAAPREILFVSDVTRELDAAREAGLDTRLCVRTPASPPPISVHRAIATFDELQ
jgi:enolase-phosphatase E1